MAVGFPAKTDFATGDVLTATNVNDITGTLNLLKPTAKGMVFSASAANTPSGLAVGNNGESLVADSSTTTGLRYNAQANANLIAGGSFDIWQRGTGAFTANGVYTSDRAFIFSSSSYSLSQESTIIPEGATYAAKITSTAGSSFGNLQFALEQSDVEKLAGKTVTFSVYLRANATYNGSSTVSIRSNTTGNTQTGGTWTTVSGATTTHTPSTSAYTRVSVTGTIPTTAKGLAFYINQTVGLPNGSILYIGLAKAELGSVATPFVRAGGSIAGELAQCQRYYTRFTADAANYYIGGRGNASSTTSCVMQFAPLTTMRITPNVLDYSNLAIYDEVTAPAVSAATILTATNPNILSATFTSSALTQYRNYTTVSQSGSAGYVGFSAEF